VFFLTGRTWQQVLIDSRFFFPSCKLSVGCCFGVEILIAIGVSTVRCFLVDCGYSRGILLTL
jgi:hypothetical protein